MRSPNSSIPRRSTRVCAHGTKRDAIAELVDLLESAHGIDSHGEVLDRVLRREAMMSTGIGNGVGDPARQSQAGGPHGGRLRRLPEGIEFESVDGEPARLFILLVAPESGGALHVKVLANISRLLKEESVRQSLREAAGSDAFVAALRAAEAVTSHSTVRRVGEGSSMHLLEAWTSLGPLHLARLLALPGAILVATLLPAACWPGARPSCARSSVAAARRDGHSVVGARGRGCCCGSRSRWQAGIPERSTCCRTAPKRAASRRARWRCRWGSRCWR